MVLALIAGWVLQQSNRVAQQLTATGQSLMQSQRLAKAVSQALVGAPSAFPDVKDSSDVLTRNALNALNSGDAGSACNRRWVTTSSPNWTPFRRWWNAPTRNAKVVLGQQKILTQVGDALRTINRQSADLLEIAETVSSLKLQQNASSAEISAAGQLVMLTQRIGKSASNSRRPKA